MCRLVKSSFFLITCFFCGLVASADLTIIGRDQSLDSPQVYSSENGIPVVNITAPNAHGLSLNTYSRFDVSQLGAILNNAQESVATQLAGIIVANPNLTRSAANVIVNEVRGYKVSDLKGNIEVAGKRAEVILVNPNGINSNGCNFYNTEAVTLKQTNNDWDQSFSIMAAPDKSEHIAYSPGKIHINQSGIVVEDYGIDADITIKAKKALLQGKNQTGKFRIEAKDSVENKGIIASTQQTITANSVHNVGKISSRTTVDIDAKHIKNEAGNIKARDHIILQANTIENTRSPIKIVNQDVHFGDKKWDYYYTEVETSDAATIQAGNAIQINGERVQNDASLIWSGGDISINGRCFENNSHYLLQQITHKDKKPGAGLMGAIGSYFGVGNRETTIQNTFTETSGVIEWGDTLYVGVPEGSFTNTGNIKGPTVVYEAKVWHNGIVDASVHTPDSFIPTQVLSLGAIADLSGIQKEYFEAQLCQSALKNLGTATFLDDKSLDRQMELLVLNQQDFLKANQHAQLGQPLSKALLAEVATPMLWWTSSSQGMLETQVILPAYFERDVGGVIRNDNATILANSLQNTGIISAKNLKVAANTFNNNRRYADFYRRDYGKIQWSEAWGKTLQTGGITSAENLILDVDYIQSGSGEWIVAGTDAKPALAREFGANFSHQDLSETIITKVLFHDTYTHKANLLAYETYSTALKVCVKPWLMSVTPPWIAGLSTRLLDTTGFGLMTGTGVHMTDIKSMLVNSVVSEGFDWLGGKAHTNVQRLLIDAAKKGGVAWKNDTSLLVGIGEAVTQNDYMGRLTTEWVAAGLNIVSSQKDEVLVKGITAGIKEGAEAYLKDKDPIKQAWSGIKKALEPDLTKKVTQRFDKMNEKNQNQLAMLAVGAKGAWLVGYEGKTIPEIAEKYQDKSLEGFSKLIGEKTKPQKQAVTFANVISHSALALAQGKDIHNASEQAFQKANEKFEWGKAKEGKEK